MGKGDAAALTRLTLQNIERALVRAGGTLAVEVRALIDPDMLVEVDAEAHISTD